MDEEEQERESLSQEAPATPMDDVTMPATRNHTVDLWPFAHPTEYYKSLIARAAGNQSLSRVLVATTTAHPAVVP